MTLSRVWLLMAVALPALVALVVPLPAVDLAYQVRAGDEILRTGALPGSDTWTYTITGTSWLDQQWLAQVLLAAGYRLGGWELLAVLRAVLVAATFGLLTSTAMLRGAGPRTASALSLIAFLIAAPALALRPQLFGIVVFAALLWLAAVRVRSPRAWWLAPVLVALWTSTHGSFVMGPLLLGYVWLDDLVHGRPATASLLVLLVGSAATLLNPFGLEVWSYAAGIGTSSVITHQVSEWQRATPLSIPGLLFYTSVLAALLVAWRGRTRLRWPDWVWLVGLAVIGAWAERGIAWWPFGAVYALVPTLSAVEVPRAERPTLIGALLAVAVGLAIVVALPWWRPSDPLTGRAGLLTYAPSGLAAALVEAAPADARVFVPQEWASWFEWAAPDARYFVDSRFELFPAGVWTDYDAIASGADGSAGALDRWAVAVMITPAGTPVPGGWTTRYADDTGAISVRPHP